jgi:hypothetical protein
MSKPRPRRRSPALAASAASVTAAIMVRLGCIALAFVVGTGFGKLLLGALR